ncbi:MAG: helix-turn-helix domain-containing protein [Chitinophagales bacterium]|nr:helix-turn-helix domain-containing protein [Chitinophagales bacterium]
MLNQNKQPTFIERIYVDMKVGHKIKKLREFKNYTQEYMAVHLEMSAANYSRLERDEIPLTLDKLQSISEVLEVNYLDILTFDEKQVFNFINHSQSQPHSQGYFHKQYNYPPDLIQKFDTIEKRIDQLEKLIKEQRDKS